MTNDELRELRNLCDRRKIAYAGIEKRLDGFSWSQPQEYDWKRDLFRILIEEGAFSRLLDDIALLEDKYKVAMAWWELERTRYKKAQNDIAELEAEVERLEDKLQNIKHVPPSHCPEDAALHFVGDAEKYGKTLDKEIAENARQAAVIEEVRDLQKWLEGDESKDHVGLHTVFKGRVDAILEKARDDGWLFECVVKKGKIIDGPRVTKLDKEGGDE